MQSPWRDLLEAEFTRVQWDLLQRIEVTPTIDWSRCSLTFVDTFRAELCRLSHTWMSSAFLVLPKLQRATRGVWHFMKHAPQGRECFGTFTFTGNSLQVRWMHHQQVQDIKERNDLINGLVNSAVRIIHPSAEAQGAETRVNTLYEKQLEDMQKGTFGKETSADFVVT